MKFCKDCAHYAVMDIWDGWIDTLPALVCNRVERFDLVSGQKAYFVLCESARDVECGKEAILFAPKETSP